MNGDRHVRLLNRSWIDETVFFK